MLELAEVFEPELGVSLVGTLANADPVVRASALEMLRRLGLGSRGTYADALADTDVSVRIEALRGAVSLNAASVLAVAAADTSREVRVVVAGGLGTVGDTESVPVLDRLSLDKDPIVRAAALEAAAQLGAAQPLTDRAIEALRDPAWQVRKGAAEALGSSSSATAKPALIEALHDTHLDVRKAAARALVGWAEDTEAVQALRLALNDTDADVRAFARRAVGASG